MLRQKGTIFHKTEEEMELMRKSGQLVSRALEVVAKMLKPGITGHDIDKAAENFIRDNGAVPGFKGYRGFPGTLCISTNECVVHGIPSNREFRDGDIVSVDCGVILNEFYGDCAYTFAIGNVEESVMELLRVTNSSLYKGIGQAVSGNRIGDIGYAIQFYAEKKHKYSIVRELVGHGVGRNLHEDPEVPNFGKRGRGIKMKEGMVIAIEPMVNLGRKEVRQAKDEWSILTIDKKASAHYEHTVAVRKKRAEILTTHQFVEEAIKKNAELKEISIKS